MKSILDPTFRYIPSDKTDLRKSFSRVRREMANGSKSANAGGGARLLRLAPKQEIASRR
jgi:hypothetical protein